VRALLRRLTRDEWLFIGGALVVGLIVWPCLAAVRLLQLAEIEDCTPEPALRATPMSAPDDLLDDWSRQVAQKTSAQADAHQARDLLDRLHRLVQHYGVLAPSNELLPLLDKVRAFLISGDGVVSGEAATSSSANVEQA
jgi:hypothetical protein